MAGRSGRAAGEALGSRDRIGARRPAPRAAAQIMMFVTVTRASQEGGYGAGPRAVGSKEPGTP